MNTVKFVECSMATYDAIQSKDESTLYFINDTKRIYKGSSIYSFRRIVFLTSTNLPANPAEKHMYISKDNKMYAYTRNPKTNQLEWTLLIGGGTDTINDDLQAISGKALINHLKTYKFESDNINYKSQHFNGSLKDALDQVFQISNNIRKSFADIIGIGDQTFEKLVNEIKTDKKSLFNNLTARGVKGIKETDPLFQLVYKVTEIKTEATPKKVYDYDITDTSKNYDIKLSSKTQLDQLALSVLKLSYEPGNFYTCDFTKDKDENLLNLNNTHGYLYDDGTLNQYSFTSTIKPENETLTSGAVVEKYEFDKSEYNSIKSLSFEQNSEDKTKNNLIVKSTYPPEVIYSKSIFLRNIESVNKITFDYTAEGNSEIGLLLIIDNKCFGISNGKFTNVDYNNMEDIRSKRITKEDLQKLTSTQYDEIFKKARTLKLGYYMNYDGVSKCEISSIKIEALAEPKYSQFYNYKYELNNDTIKLSINENGKYKVIVAE